MSHSAYYLVYILALALLSLLGSCRTQEVKRSPLFTEVFQAETAMFRGVSLGDSLNVPQRNELPTQPKYMDSLGIAYQFQLSTEHQLIVEYYSDHKKSDNPKNIVASIIANVILDDEIETAQFYNEIQAYFNSIEAYGLSSGTYGNYTWESLTQNNHRMEIVLKLDDSKKGITINFIDTGTDI